MIHLQTYLKIISENFLNILSDIIEDNEDVEASKVFLKKRKALLSRSGDDMGV